MADEQQRRAFTRVHVKIEADVSAGTTRLISNRTRDISFNGLYVYAPTPLPPGAECRVTLQAAGADTPALIEVKGRVIHADEKGMGIQFTQTPSADSLTHLRNIVLLHAEDPDEVEREFYAHVTMHRKPSEE